MVDIDSLSVVELAARIRKGEVTCVQATQRYIENMEKHRELNAIIYLNKERALEEASRLDRELTEKGASGVGRLHGVPLIIKDNIHVAGMPNTAGCPALKDFIPSEDAPTVSALRREGALILAKVSLFY